MVWRLIYHTIKLIIHVIALAYAIILFLSRHVCIVSLRNVRAQPFIRDWNNWVITIGNHGNAMDTAE